MMIFATLRLTHAYTCVCLPLVADRFRFAAEPVAQNVVGRKADIVAHKDGAEHFAVVAKKPSRSRWKLK